MKTVQIKRNMIRVSRHEDGQVFFDHRVMAILPGCRVTTLLTESPSTGKIWLKPLFGHSGEANVHPADWAEVIESAAVIPDQLFPVEITPEIEHAAREYCLSITTCPAVKSLEHVHPNYLAGLAFAPIQMPVPR